LSSSETLNDMMQRMVMTITSRTVNTAKINSNNELMMIELFSEDGAYPRSCKVITFALLIDLALLTCCVWICELGLCDSKICAQATAQERQRGNVADLPCSWRPPQTFLLAPSLWGNRVLRYLSKIAVSFNLSLSYEVSTYKYLQSAFITVLFRYASQPCFTLPLQPLRICRL